MQDTQHDKDRMGIPSMHGRSMRKMVLGLAFGVTMALTMVPGTAQAWWNDEWSMRKPLAIDTSAAGAGINDPIGTLPVLIRLHTGNFRFDIAKEDGGDLRFIAGDDKTPLKHHIEAWDNLLGEAFVWVQVPDLKPGTKTEFWLYYGNAKAPAAEDVKGTQDAQTTLVYHFTDRNQPARDWSAWNNQSLSPITASDGALIGPGLKLDGQTSVTIPGAPSLAWADGASMTWSAWVKPTPASGPTTGETAIFARREGANALVVGSSDGVPFVEVSGATGTVRATAAATLTDGTWHRLAVTATGTDLVLSVDGVAAATAVVPLPAMVGVATLGADPLPTVSDVAAPVSPAAATPNPATPAGASKAASPVVAAPLAAPVAVARAGFVGEIDEMTLAKVARPLGYLRAATLSEGPDGSKFLSVGIDEETASWISGYFAVILNSVTLDGWVVIGILAVMAVVSWVVMVDKSLYVGRQMKANKKFQKKFRGVIRDLTALDRGDLDEDDETDAATEEDRALRSSSLYRIYHVGVREILGRLKEGSAADVASGEAIASIRASLDGSLVRETQRLNRAMVLLTLAIAGGPFLGLLGTVVGVMITFAAIAASGDVNVNAIAPGIAAALVATVAGLAVAIPALFGYNYLNTKIADATSDMQVFVDEFVTKMAEAYRKRGDARLAAAE